MSSVIKVGNKYVSRYFCKLNDILAIKQKATAEEKYAQRDGTVEGRTKRYVQSAKRRNLQWALNDHECHTLFTAACHYCAESPPAASLNGIDRIDSTKGYTRDNVVACCKQCNWAKGRLTYHQFLTMCRKIAARHANDDNASVPILSVVPTDK